MKGSITISTATLRALLLHAPKDDVRYYLNGIAIEPATGHAIATDGYTLIVARIGDDHADSCASDDAPFIIPRDTCELALKAAGKLSALTIQYLQQIGDKTPPTVSFAPAGVSATAIDGKYPDWRRVIPAGPFDGSAAQVNAGLAKRCSDSLEMIVGGKKDNPRAYFHHQGPEKALLVTRAGADAFCVLMPLGNAYDDSDISAILTARKPPQQTMEEAA